MVCWCGGRMTLIKKLWDWLNEEIENTKKDRLAILNPRVQLGRLQAYKEVKQKLLEFAKEDLKNYESALELLKFYSELKEDLEKIVREEGWRNIGSVCKIKKLKLKV